MSEDTAAAAPAATHAGDIDPMRPALERLQAQPGRFGFFQAVRLLYSANGFDGRGNGARPGPLRFTTPASLAFPTSELAAIDGHDQVAGDVRGGGRVHALDTHVHTSGRLPLRGTKRTMKSSRCWLRTLSRV